MKLELFSNKTRLILRKRFRVYIYCHDGCQNMCQDVCQKGHKTG